MAQVFGRRANTLVTLSFIGGALGLALLVVVWWFFTRSDYIRQVNVPIEQPVAFQHTVHVNGLRMECQYCHHGVADSPYANIPATETCMSCHSQVLLGSEELNLVRDSWESNTPIAWNYVHKAPEFVYFNHSIHVNKGVGCSTCHGQVNNMEVVYKVEPMYMSWCLNCHRNPEEYLRPVEEVYNMNYEPPANQRALGEQLVQEYGIVKDNLTNCAICHR